MRSYVKPWCPVPRTPRRGLRTIRPGEVELNARFRQPVASGHPLQLRAWVARSSPPLFVLRAELWQAGQVRATAIGKFMEKRRTAATRMEDAACRGHPV